MFSHQFRPGLWPSLAAGAGIAATLALGVWQLGRGSEKDALQAQFEARRQRPAFAVGAAAADAAALAGQAVIARGSFVPAHTVYIDNRLYRGVPGYHVVTPLRLDGSDMHVLVNRGWIAGGGRGAPPAVVTPEGSVELRGVAVLPSTRFLELSSRVAEGNVWQNLVLERYRQAVPIPVHSFVVQQESAAADGLVREWPAPNAGADKNYAYAAQWFTMALAIALLYLFLNLRRSHDD